MHRGTQWTMVHFVACFCFHTFRLWSDAISVGLLKNIAKSIKSDFRGSAVRFNVQFCNSVTAQRSCAVTIQRCVYAKIAQFFFWILIVFDEKSVNIMFTGNLLHFTSQNIRVWCVGLQKSRPITNRKCCGNKNMQSLHHCHFVFPGSRVEVVEISEV